MNRKGEKLRSVSVKGIENLVCEVTQDRGKKPMMLIGVNNDHDLVLEFSNVNERKKLLTKLETFLQSYKKRLETVPTFKAKINLMRWIVMQSGNDEICRSKLLYIILFLGGGNNICLSIFLFISLLLLLLLNQYWSQNTGLQYSNIFIIIGAKSLFIIHKYLIKLVPKFHLHLI